MGKAAFGKYLLIFLMIAVFLVISRNVIITGNITGEQTVFNLGVLQADPINYNDTKYAAVVPLINERIQYGVGMATSPSLFQNLKMNPVLGDDSNFESTLKEMKTSDTNIIFMGSSTKLMNLTENETGGTIIVSPDGLLSFYDMGIPVFFLRDHFLTPAIVMADSMLDYNITKVGIIYVNTPIFKEKDFSGPEYSSIFSKVVGEISFIETYYTENGSGADRILNLINSTGTEAIAFLGYGTFTDDFSLLLAKIKNDSKYDSDVKLFSIGWGSSERVFDFSEQFQDLLIVETDYLPEKLWERILETPYFLKSEDGTYNSTEPIHHVENPKEINLDLVKDVPNDFKARPGFLEKEGESHPYPFTIEAYIFVEIFRSLVEKCGNNNLECMKTSLLDDVFETAVGRTRFRNDGVIMRPYLLKKIPGKEEIQKDMRGFITLKRYVLSDIDNTISSYGLDISV